MSKLQEGPTAEISPYVLQIIGSTLCIVSNKNYKEMTITVPRNFVRGCVSLFEKIPKDDDEVGEIAYCLERLKTALEGAR